MRKFLLLPCLLIFVLATSVAWSVSLSANKPVEFNFSNSEESLAIEIVHPGDRFLAIEVDFTGTATSTGVIGISGSNEIKIGQIVWENSFNIDAFAHDGPVSIVDKIMPIRGNWHLTVAAGQVPVSGKLKLVDLGPVTPVEFSEKTGAIQIKKPDIAEIKALGNVEHPDFPGASGEFSGSLTADGDVIIPLPVGYYTLKKSAPLLMSMQAHMIPVHAGKITVIENWPQSPQPEPEPGDNEDTTASVTAQIEKDMKVRSIRLLENDEVLVRFATPNWQGTVEKEELEVHEGGVPATVVSANTVATPLSLTILLDSSGSMKKDMKLAIASVEQFIRLLPADSEINLVDFDTKAKELVAKDRNSLLQLLKAVKADGATCLNDSVMLGLKKSANKSRPAILLFTDGFDANYNDTAPGSVTRPEEMFETVKASEIPVFTIGFGEKPDDATLKRLATLSGGVYSKADQKNIGKVFAQVASILGREHEMVYKRPGMRGNSEAPVISIVLDVSGSMNSSPAEEGCDYRIEKAKAILRSLINVLPEDAIVQITAYSFYQNVVQVFTGDKTQLLASLSPIEAGGGTATLETLQFAFKMLNVIPTDRKYMLFITDAGLNVVENPVEGEALEYATVLGSIRDAGIHMTWVGMVDNKEKAPFDAAAKLCNGNAVVSTDLAAVQEAIDNFGKTILTATGTPDDRTPVQLTLSHREDNGRMLIMNAAEKFKMPVPPVTSKASVNGIRLSYIDMPQNLERYSLELSKDLYGNSKTRDETIITQRLPINAVGSNKAMRLTAIETMLMTKFRGIELKCAAIKLRCENILPEQDVAVISDSESHPASIVGNAGRPIKTVKAVPPYLIPSLRNHFFARLTNSPAVPPSDLSWAVEDPLMTPDDESLQIQPGEVIEGYLIFELTESETLNKAGLSFYDTNYGNIHIPLIGIMEPATETARIAALPKIAEGHISDSFKLNLTGFSDSALPEPPEQLALRIFDLQLTSQVQALLDLNPAERLSLLLPTRFGNLVIAPSPRTETLPMGWYRSLLFAPGSNNLLRQAYVIPQSLKEKVKGTLRVDIAGNELMLAGGDALVKQDKSLTTGAGDQSELSVNAWKLEDGIAYFDMTLSDAKDGEGVSVEIADICSLHAGEEKLTADEESTEFMFLPTSKIEVADGQQRRFLLIFRCADVEEEQMTLKSDLFKLDLPLKAPGNGTFDHYMQTAADNWQPGHSMHDEIAAMVEKVHAARLARGWKKKGAANADKASPGEKTVDQESPKENIAEELVLPAPDIKAAVDERMQSMMKLKENEFLDFIRELRCIPAERSTGQAIYAPEAVLMQGWGTQDDLFELTRNYYKTNGAIVNDIFWLATLSEQGKEELFKLTGWETELESLPVLEANGKKLIMPFARSTEELAELISEITEAESEPAAALKCSINISLQVRSRNADQAAMMGSMGDALGGGADDDGTTLVPVLETEPINLSLCSRSPLDIIYFSPDSGRTLYVAVEGADGKIENIIEPFDLSGNEVLEEVIEIRLDEETLTFNRPIEKSSSLVDTFRTIALCMPDFPASAASTLADEFASRKTSEAPGTKSTAKWFARSKIYEFLALHSEAEAEAMRCTGVKTGRPGARMRAIIFTLTHGNDKLNAVMDLRQINARVQGDEQAVRAFNYYMGFANAIAEEQAIGGNGLISRWLCDSQRINLVGPEEIEALVEILAQDKRISEATRNRILGSTERGEALMLPSLAPEINGRLLLSWMTLDPETYAINSVIETGEHGAGVEYNVNQMIEDANKVGIGFLAGTETSIWAVTAFRLKYDDMRKVVIAAKKLCMDIAKQLSDLGSMPQLKMGDASLETSGFSGSVGNVKLNVGFGDTSSAKLSEFFKKPVVGFSFSYKDGFELAVKNYFGG